MKAAPPIIPAETARHLLLGGAGLLEDPDRPASAARVLKQIERMGFVQVDTINTVERAHQHILLTRFDRYRPATLTRLLERERTLFEHWTHDASIIPIGLYPQWRYRFERAKQPDHRLQSWALRKIGRNANRVIEHVLERIEKEGPLMSRDFEEVKSARTKERGEGWWNWKPQKAALEYLWRIGELSISARTSFQKVYELSSRWLPEHHEQPPPSQDGHLDWACREALERLVIATPRELQQFWLAIGIDSARRWCKEATATGEVIEVELASADGSKSRKAIAKPDWKRRAARLADAPRRIRLLNPFDPAIRDRQRTLRLFDFEYAFEAFVPESKRRFGYYVMPLLEGDRLIGRVDPKFHRDQGTLEVRRVWWEAGIKPTQTRRRALHEATERFAEQIGAEQVRWPKGWTAKGAARKRPAGNAKPSARPVVKGHGD